MKFFRGSWQGEFLDGLFTAPLKSENVCIEDVVRIKHFRVENVLTPCRRAEFLPLIRPLFFKGRKQGQTPKFVFSISYVVSILT